MKRYKKTLIVAAALFRVALFGLGHVAAGEIDVESAQIRLIDDVEVPAQAQGVLKSLDVREGQLVGEGDPIAQIDEAEAKLLRDRAQIDLDTAMKKEKNDVKLRLAQKAVRDARLAVDRAVIDLDIAGKQAANDVRVRLATKTTAVAVAEFDRAIRSRKIVRDAVSQSEVDMLQLSVEKSSLEIEQADLDLEVAQLMVRVQEAEVERLKLGIESSTLDEEQARHDLEVAADDRRAKANGLDMSELKLGRRRIVSPISGVVAKVFRRRGEWVEPGETVMRIVRMDRLRIEGFVDAAHLGEELTGLSATITARLPKNPTAKFTGEVVFVSPEVDPVNNQVRVWVEVDNPQMELRPGMRVTMTIMTKDEAK
jgi:multidrug efflux pump subunit AcrA (membrane-fusion protein)